VAMAGQPTSVSNAPFVGEHVGIEYRDGRDVQGTVSSTIAEGMLLILATGRVEFVKYDDVSNVRDLESGRTVTIPAQRVRRGRLNATRRDSASRAPVIGTHVQVEYRDGRKVEGAISSMTADGMLLVMEGGTVEGVKYDDILDVRELESGRMLTIP